MENLSRNSNRNCFERISPTSKSKQMQRRSLRSLVEAGFSARWNAHVGSPQKNPIQTDQSEICQFVLLASMKTELCFTDLPFSNDTMEKKGKYFTRSFTHISTTLIPHILPFSLFKTQLVTILSLKAEDFLFFFNQFLQTVNTDTPDFQIFPLTLQTTASSPHYT